MTKWVLLGIAIVCEVTASLSLKGALDRPALYAAAVAGYVISFVLLVGVLKQGMPLGVAYGIWGALGVAATAGMSTVLFDEAFTAVMGAGMVLVVAGVLAVELGADRARDAAGATVANPP